MVSSDQSLAKCSYCNAIMTVPKTEKRRMTLYNRANTLRMNQEFDQAILLYQNILLENEKEEDAYWGVALCKYGIEYVRDEKTEKMIPTCHRAVYTPFLQDKDYLNALKYANPEKQNFYRKEGGYIDEILEKILQRASNETPCDVFLCYKETDMNGNRTQDSVYAAEIYKALTQQRFRVFYARETLQLGMEYEPQIFAALHSAKLMFVIGTDASYFEATWVRNEWGRYLEIIQKQKDRVLIPLYKGLNPDRDFPYELRRFQAYDLDTMGYLLDIVDVAKKIVTPLEKIEEEYGENGAEEYICLAETEIKEYRFDTAAEFYMAALELYPNDSRLWWGLLRCKTENFSPVGRTELFTEEEQKIYNQLIACSSAEQKIGYKEKIEEFNQRIQTWNCARYYKELQELQKREKECCKEDKEHWRYKENYDEWLEMYKKLADKLQSYSAEKGLKPLRELLDYKAEVYALIKRYKSHDQTTNQYARDFWLLQSQTEALDKKIESLKKDIVSSESAKGFFAKRKEQKKQQNDIETLRRYQEQKTEMEQKCHMQKALLYQEMNAELDMIEEKYQKLSECFFERKSVCEIVCC